MPGIYFAVVVQSLEDLSKLIKKRAQVDLDIANKKSFVRVAIKQLPPEDRRRFEVQLDALTPIPGSLTDAVREALRIARASRGASRGWVTTAQVRDLVMDSGYDFSGYKSNPLASVHTVLTRRLKPEEVEVETIKGVMHFRWKGQYTLEDMKLAEIIN